MMRSLSSGVSGLKAHQMAMDVIGNNIANVNTVGFKGGRVTFQEVFSETIKGAGSPQTGRGGTNPQQVGLGISVASVDTIMSRGAVNRTDVNTDLCISGNGFFIVSEDAQALNRSYTRAGNFIIDKDGNLVTPNGMKVLGYMYDEATGLPKPTLEGLKIPVSAVSNPLATTTVAFEGNLNSNGDVKTATASGYTREAPFKVFDSLGNTHDIKITFEHTGAADWRPTVTFDGVAATVDPTSGTVKFKSDGSIDTTGITSLKIKNTAGSLAPASDMDFTVSLSELTAVANESTASATSVNGYNQGTLESFSITPSGEIKGVFSNGQSRTLGRVALANFKNAAGLEKTGENLYKTSNNSGEAIVGTPGDGGMGQINPGSLEMSNVDLAKEFTSMITIQRGFQANSKIITTSDEMLQELVNLKR